MSTSTRSGRIDVGTLSPLHYVGVLAAVVSGAIHLYLGVSFAPSALGISFLFAGVVFLAAAGAVLVDYRRATTYRLGVPFVAGQVVLWYYLNFAGGEKAFPADVGTLGAVDKVAQVVLLLVLVALIRRE